MDVMVIARCMIKLFIVLVLGFVLYRFDILDGRTSKKLSSMVVKVTAPLWIISTALSASTENRLGVLVLFGAGILMYIGFILFARFITWIFRVNPKDRPLYECMLVFSNNSFMGFRYCSQCLAMRQCSIPQCCTFLSIYLSTLMLCTALKRLLCRRLLQEETLKVQPQLA